MAELTPDKPAPAMPPFARLAAWLKKAVVRDVIIVCAAVLLITVPFLNKAFDWDDREWIEFAQVMAHDPTRFDLRDLSYKGNFYESFRTSHPPLLSEYLALFLRMGFQVSERLFRAAYLIFPLIAALAMYSLGRRFTSSPLIASLLLVFTPGFLVISHTLMGDLPGLAMWLASVALFVWGADRYNWKLLMASGAVMALATLIAYQTLSLLPLLLFYALVKRRFRLRVFLPFLIPVFVFGAYTWYTWHLYGGLPVFSYQVGLGFGWQNLDLKIRALLVFMGGAIIFPLSLGIFLRKKVDVLAGFLLIPPLVTWAVMYYMGKGEIDLVEGLQIAVLVTAGFLILYKMISATITGLVAWARKRRGWTDSLFLLVWFLGILTYAGVFLPFVAVRFLLPLFPPVVLLFIREAEGLWPMRARLRSAFVAVTLALTLAAGLAAAVADYRLAGLYRDEAAQLSEQFAGSGRQVWFLGEFGFRYYMQKNGFEYLGVNSVAHPGDIVISSQIASENVVAPLPEGYYRVLERIEPQDPFPVRIMNPWAGAGFYAHLVGPLPFVPSTDKMDEITVYELTW